MGNISCEPGIMYSTERQLSIASASKKGMLAQLTHWLQLADLTRNESTSTHAGGH
mgnify:CR=1 FL=1